MKPKKKGIPIEDGVKNLQRIFIQLKELAAINANTPFKDKFLKLAEAAEYANPSTDEGIARLDIKISAELGNLKIMFASKQPAEHIEYKLANIASMITERTVKA